MIAVICPNCGLAIRVIGNPVEVDSLVGKYSEFWPDKYPCPRCSYGCANGCLEAALDGRITDFVELSPIELFSALNGLGLPDEADCRLETVIDLLRTHPIRKVVGVDIPHTGRCVVHQLELWDGTRLYFGSGPEGAVIYRNVPPQTYVEKIRG